MGRTHLFARFAIACSLLLISTLAFAQTPVPVPPEEQPGGDGPKPVPVNPDELPPDQRPPEEKPPEEKPPEQQKPPEKPPEQKPPEQPKAPDKKPPVIPPPRELPKVKDEVVIRAAPEMQIDQVSAQTPLMGGEVIKSIVVEENKKTDSDTVIFISGLDKGDSFSAGDAKVAKDKLVSCGLFKKVTVYWSMVQGGVRVHLQVKDKHSWIIAPAFYNQPTNVGGGIGFGENNLFGQNQKLLLYGQIATGDSFFIGAWVIPSIANTRFYAQFDTFLKSARNIEYASPTAYLDITDEENPNAGSNPIAVRESRIHYLNGGVKLGIELFRGLKIDSRFRAAKVSYVDDSVGLSEPTDNKMAVLGVDVAEDPMRPGKPLQPGGEGWDVSSENTISLDRRANYYGIQTGYKVGFSFEKSLGSLSDFDYWLAGLSIYKAKKILDRHNLVGKFFAGYGHNLPFQQEYQTGGTSMRGWLNGQFRGNLKVSGTAEYSLPISPEIFGLGIRGLVFWDSAYTTFTKDTDDPVRQMEANRNYLPNADARGLTPLKNSVGVGTRFYLRQIVLPLLGLDVGYGLEARDVQIYLAIGLTD
ncbi:MAG: BamA/TamA family outer membrane protein [Myxococcota bacterium]|nr:BamA/TamA family outer membrane protein [Myxococcota bacterium]